MSHAVETMFSVREVPWHGLGVILDAPPSSEEAIKQAGLDWGVEARDIFWQSKMNPQRFVQVPERKMLVRTKDESPLSVVGRDYQVLQNLEAFQFFDPIVDAKIAAYETAGSLQDGRKIWILARINEDFQIGVGDVIRQYVLLCNGHDGNTGVMIQPTPIRVVCNNTLMASLGAGMVQHIVHRGDLKAKMEQAADIIGFTTKRFQELKTQYLFMASKTITTEQRIDYLRALIPDVSSEASPRMRSRVAAQRDGILQLLDTGRSTALPNFDKGTVWAIYNCAVEFADWSLGSRSRDIGNYQLFGQGALFKRRALDLAMKLADGKPLVDDPNGIPGDEAATVDLSD